MVKYFADECFSGRQYVQPFVNHRWVVCLFVRHTLVPVSQRKMGDMEAEPPVPSDAAYRQITLALVWLMPMHLVRPLEHFWSSKEYICIFCCVTSPSLKWLFRHTRKASCRWQTRATFAKSLHGLRNSSGVLRCIASLPIDSLPMVSYYRPILILCVKCTVFEIFAF